MKISELARELYEKHGLVEPAVKELQAMTKTDQSLYNDVTRPYLERACYDTIKRVCQHKRIHIWKAPNYDKGGNGHRVKSHANTMLDMPLSTGKKLRHATAEDLFAESELYKKQANTMLHFSRWYSKLAESVGEKTVEDVFDDDDLKEIQEQTANAA